MITVPTKLIGGKRFWGCCTLCFVAQLCPTLCDPVDCRPPGSSVHGTLQARALEWVAMPPSRGSSQPRDRTQVSHRIWQEDPLPSEPPGMPVNIGVGVLSLLQGMFPTQGSEVGSALGSPAWQADPSPAEPLGKPKQDLGPKSPGENVTLLSSYLDHTGSFTI